MLTMLFFLFSVALGSPWPELPLDQPGESSASDAAVIVGIDRYFVVDDVPGATRNAEDWYRYFTAVRAIPPARVRLLRDGEGTRERIMKEVEQAARLAGPGGRVWFVFIGHGVPMPDGTDGALVGVDAQGEPNLLFPRSVRRSELLRLLAGVEGVLVLDACFSGRSAGGSLLPDLQFLVPTWASEPTQSAVLSAGAATEFAGALPGGGRPAYSYLLLGGLLGWADADADGVVTAEEASIYAREALSATVRGRTQTPERTGPDLVLARQASAPGPSIAEIVLQAPLRPPSGASQPAEQQSVLDQRRAAHELRLAADLREAARRESAPPEVRDQLDQARSAILDQAEEAYHSLTQAIGSGSPGAREQAQAFVQRFGNAFAEVGSHWETVVVPEVDRVRAWLRTGDLNARTTAISVPPPPRKTRLPWRLWRKTSLELSSDYESDPARAFEIYTALFYLPEQIHQACGGGCSDIAEAAESLRSSALTYSMARLEPALSGLNARQTASMMVGMRAEAQDHWYAAAGSERPLLLVEDWSGFIDAVPSRRSAWQIRAGLIELAQHMERRGVSGRCASRVQDQRRDLLRRYAEIDPEAGLIYQADLPALADLLDQALRLAARSERCR